MKSIVRTAALTGGATLAALLSAGPAAATGLARLAADTSGDLYVAVVIDFGGYKGAPANVATCVKVPQGDTDADALAAAVGQGNLAYAPSGLLCAIDGVPANGVADCNATSNGEYFFWSYWNGKDGSWSYADVGPASTLATPGDVEGWRFQDPGPASSSAPAPATAPDFAQLCPAEYAAAPATATTSPPVTPTTVPAAPGAHTAPTTSPTTPAAAKASGGAPAAAGSTTNTVVPGRSATRATTTTPTVSPGARSAPRAPPHAGAPKDLHALGPVHHTAPGGGGDWLAPVLVAVLILGLGTAALLRWRRRSGET